MTASYTFTLPGVYCFLFANDCGARGHTQRTGFAKSVDAELGIISGGIEANYTTAHWVNVRTASTEGRVRYDDAYLYTLSKLQYATSLLTLTASSALASGGNDIDNYVLLLADRANRVGDADRASIASRLRVASLWNLADPMLWASVYGLLVRHVALGERQWTLPLPRISGATVFAVPRFNLGPFGAEHYVDAFVHAPKSHAVASAYVRAGSSGIGSYVGGGARLYSFPVAERVTMGAELDVFRQPELLFEERAVYNRRELWGWNAGLSLEWRFRERMGVLGRAAYKTRGHVMGQPLEEGVHGYLGLTLDIDRLR